MNETQEMLRFYSYFFISHASALVQIRSGRLVQCECSFFKEMIDLIRFLCLLSRPSIYFDFNFYTLDGLPRELYKKYDSRCYIFNLCIQFEGPKAFEE